MQLAYRDDVHIPASSTEAPNNPPSRNAAIRRTQFNHETMRLDPSKSALSCAVQSSLLARIITATCIMIAPKRLKLRLSGSARKSQKRFRDTPTFKISGRFGSNPAVLSRSVEKRGDQSRFKCRRMVNYSAIRSNRASMLLEDGVSTAILCPQPSQIGRSAAGPVCKHSNSRVSAEPSHCGVQSMSW
jgi:hypothetical protein